MEKRSTISKKTLKIILGICIGVTILAVAGYLTIHTWQITIRWDGRFPYGEWDVSGLDAKQAEMKRSLRNLQIVRYPFRKMIRKFTVQL